MARILLTFSLFGGLIATAAGANSSLRGSSGNNTASGATTVVDNRTADVGIISPGTELGEAEGNVTLGSSTNSSVVAGFGCVRIVKFVMDNKCGKDLWLKGWNRWVPPGVHEIHGRRNTDIQRISWKLKGGPWGYDYIELNGNWRGSGMDFCAHPNYATWYGFSTSSKYEALDPWTGQRSCEDAGAAVNFTRGNCPARARGSRRYYCNFHATQASIRNCASRFAKYQMAHTWAIHKDGSRKHLYNCRGSRYREWCGNYVNYPCAPESHNWPGFGIGSWIDCTNRRKTIIMKITTCIS